MRSQAKKNREDGAVLIIILWILVILVFLAISVGRRSSIELRLLRYHLSRAHAQYLAQAALERIYQEKLNDADMEHDALKESWSNKLDSGKEPEFKDFALGNGSFEVKYDYYESREDEKQTLYGMQDEQSKYNINKVLDDVDARANEFKALLENVLGASATTDSDVLMDAFIDWIDADNVVSGNYGKEEYEDGIEPKNAPLDRLEELLMIDGYTSAIVEQISNYVTVYGDGKINLNTAPKEVFLALGLSEDVAQDILNYRNGLDGVAATEDDAVIETENLADLRGKDPGIPEGHFSANEDKINATSERFSVKSSFYRAASYGTAGAIAKKITAVVEIPSNTTETKAPQLRYYYEE